MTAIRFNITGNALYEVVQILFGPARNAARAAFISNSIIRDKVFDASMIQPINQALVREELIRYIYELYFSNFGAPSQQVDLSNRLRDLRALDPIGIYQEGLFEFNRDGVPGRGRLELQNQILDTSNRIAGRILTAQANREPIPDLTETYIQQQLRVRVLNYLNTTQPDSPTIRQSLGVKSTYLVNPFFVSFNVYDLSTTQDVVRDRVFRVERSADRTARPVGIFFDPEVYNNSFDLRVTVGIGTLSDEEIEELQEAEAERLEIEAITEIDDQLGLDPDNLTEEQAAERQANIDALNIDPDEIEVGESTRRITRRYTYNGTRATRLLNALNGRLNRAGYALYLNAIEDATGFSIEALTFYSVRYTATQEFLLPIFNANNLQSGYGLFNRDSARTFNLNNI
jgi:hypothetical protein